MPELPDRLVRAILYSHGEDEGRAWLRTLPRRVGHYLRRWQLEPLGVAEGGTAACCLFCRDAQDRDVVLKVPVDPAAGRAEARALRRWAETGASPQVLAVARRSGVFLMSRVLPGVAAQPVGESWESGMFVDLLARLSSPPPLHGLPALGQVLQRRIRFAEGRFSEPGYEAAARRFEAVREDLGGLLASPARVDMLHGDLQFKNILIDGAGRWLAIDPRACTGDVNAEAALWAVVQPAGSIAERITELADCSLLDEARLTRWCRGLALLEYRRSWPESARRTEDFLGLPSS